ncbi:MAG: DUF488 family protein [Acidobacteriota bacterium]|nr:DUF488 family protein [Acidobacteriota bacterium]
MSRSADVTAGRVRDSAETERARLLVERLWLRGVTRVALNPYIRLRAIAPTDALPTWFGHHQVRRDAFCRHYRCGLDANPEAVAEAPNWCRRRPVTLLISACARPHNQAIVLKGYLRERLDQESNP